MTEKERSTTFGPARAGEGSDRSCDGRSVVAAPRAQYRLRVGADVAYGGRNTPRARVERERPHRRGGGPSVRGPGQGDPESVSGSVPFDRAVEYYDRTRGMSETATREMVGVLGAELAGRGRCLEVGVGTGLVALPLAEAGVPMVGVDLSGRCRQARGEGRGQGSVPAGGGGRDELPLADDRLAERCSSRPASRAGVEARPSELIRVVSSGGVVLESAVTSRGLARATDRFKSLAGERPSSGGSSHGTPALWIKPSRSREPSAFVAADHRRVPQSLGTFLDQMAAGFTPGRGGG